ncbi:hypothetical protein ACFL3V_04830 [Nanoarchaeota archaeon]
MKQKQSRNYLLLGASLLIVGLLVEYLSEKVIAYPMNTVYKTLLIMVMIAVGYSFAEGVIHPFAKRSLQIIQKPFTSIAGATAGKALFYIVIYAILFTLYLLVFTYSMDVGNINILQIN